jgi:hypothetical protein
MSEVAGRNRLSVVGFGYDMFLFRRGSGKRTGATGGARGFQCAEDTILLKVVQSLSS